MSFSRLRRFHRMLVGGASALYMWPGFKPPPVGGPRSRPSIELFNPIKCDTGGNEVVCIANVITSVLFDFAVVVSPIVVLVGAFQIMFAAGSEESIHKGKKTILYAVVGLVIALLATSVTSIIRSTFG